MCVHTHVGLYSLMFPGTAGEVDYNMFFYRNGLGLLSAVAHPYSAGQV